MVVQAGLNPATTPVSKLPFPFIVTGILDFWLLSAFTFGVIPSMAEGAARGPWMWAAAHLAVLGWALMTAMGAMYQLISVALQVKIYSEKLGWIQYFVYAVGVLGLVPSFFLFNRSALIFFGSLTFAGILLFIFNMGMTAAAMKKQTYISAYVFSALAYLFITVTIGLLLVFNFSGNFLGPLHEQLFRIHLMTGLIGWFTLLLLGFSYKMAPMFSLAHGYKEKLPVWILWLFHVGIVLTAVSILAGSFILQIVGLLLLTAGFVVFAIQLRDIIKHRMKKKLDIGMNAALAGAGFGVICFLFLPFVIALGSTGSLVFLLYLLILGWISFSIAGYLYKIVPFLWWTKKYSAQMGKTKVPLLKELINEAFGKWTFLFFLIGIVGFSLGILVHSAAVLYASQVVLFGSISCYTYAVFAVFRK